MMMKKTGIIIALILFVCGGITGCSVGANNKTGQKETLTLAVFQEDALLAEYVADYNAAQEDHEVMIKNYFMEGETYLSLEDAVNKLMMELAAGKGPDVVNWGFLYSPAYVCNEAFLDLSDMAAELPQEDYVGNVIEAFATEKGLYVLVPEFHVSTMALKKEQKGQIEEWNTAALMDFYELHKDETMLFPGETALSVFGYLCRGGMSQFVDWSKGNCDFEQEAFLRLLEFSNEFPKSLHMDETVSVKKLYQEGKALLYPLVMTGAFDTKRVETMFGEHEVEYMGYPVGSRGGNVANITQYALSINVSGKHIEEAKDFVMGTIQKEFQAKLDELPVSRKLLQQCVEEAMVIEYEIGAEGVQEPVVKEWLRFEGEEPMPLYQISKQNAADFWELLDSVETNSVVDSTIYSIILEEADSYFSGEKKATDVARIINNRVQLYIKEQL